RVDNCVIELDGPEPPGLDGSAAGFVDAVRSAGTVLQTTRRPQWAADEPVMISAGGATITLHPPEGPGLRLSYILDYGPLAPISRQAHTIDLRPETFAAEVAACRTFLTEPEARVLR